jgi:hypothetical protein
MSNKTVSPTCPNAYSRAMLEKWRNGKEWHSAASAWLRELANLHGKENFRIRKGTANPDVKEIAEEVLPLGIWMDVYSKMAGWEACFSQRGSRADALLRETASSPRISLQIVGAFDGAELAAQMRELNAEGFSNTRVQSRSEIVEELTGLILDRINRKAAHEYPPDFWLLVAAEDRFTQLSTLPEVIAQAQAAASQTRFAQVHLIGMTGKEAFRLR